MENKKLHNNINRIKSLIGEQETKEGLVSDIKDYLIDKVQGAISGTELGDALDSIMTSTGLGTTEKMKTALNVPKNPASTMSSAERQKIFSKVKNDDDFYAHILWGLNLPVTKNNIDFLKLWRIAEMGVETGNQGKRTAVNNPLNTTQSHYSDTEQTNFNSVGVKNFSKPEYGIESTIKTLKNGYYNCILDGLRRELPYEQIADCVTGKSNRTAMDVWGTTTKHMKNVLKNYKGKVLDPKKIDFTID